MKQTVIDRLAASNAYRARYPDRDIKDMLLLGEGWDNVVYLIDETLVLRFPKTQNAARALPTEMRLLQYLRDRLPLSVPQPTIIGTHPVEPDWPFMGYACIAGAQLTPERFWALSPVARDSVMQNLAAFLEALHAVTVDGARDCGVTPRDLHAEFSDVFARSEALVIPALERRERTAFVAWVRAILDDAEYFAVTPALTHGDMSPEHILYDSATRRLSGVIDFGDAAIADPDYDLLYLLEDYGEPFLRALLQHYHHNDPKQLLAKLQAFRLFDAARYTLFGYARSDTDMVRCGLTDLSELLREASGTEELRRPP